MKCLTVVGARPQFIKAAAQSRALAAAGIEEVLVHTGQHFDEEMSEVFFRELGIRMPSYNLGVAGGRHGAMTGEMLKRIEATLIEESPQVVLVLGDTNSTLAGALAAAKLHIPVAHVEAGLRSFNRRMPEEVNRVLTDHLSRLLLCPSALAVRNLEREGISRGVHEVGDVMADLNRLVKERLAAATDALDRLDVAPGSYYLATCHRPENTDDPARLSAILSALGELPAPVVFPLHPRTRKAVAAAGLCVADNVTIIQPCGYLDIMTLLQHTRVLLTDSGGMQKEAYWMGVPCVTMRDETEWVETVESGWNQVVGADAGRIVTAARAPRPTGERPVLYGDGRTSERCAELIAGL